MRGEAKSLGAQDCVLAKSLGAQDCVLKSGGFYPLYERIERYVQ
jgi:hypothetical protein